MFHTGNIGAVYLCGRVSPYVPMLFAVRVRALTVEGWWNSFCFMVSLFNPVFHRARSIAQWGKLHFSRVQKSACGFS
jgi:hypothetical protein